MEESEKSNIQASAVFSGEPTIENIKKFHADRNRLSIADLDGRSRKPHIVEARFDAIAEVYVTLRDLTLTDIGIEFGGRNYATIRNALEQRDIDVPVAGIIDREAVVADAKKGLSIVDLAYKYHCSRPSIRNILYEAKVPFKQ